ncbi:TrmH family RNA methyltransferase [Timonella sp. A28]|uniref:TrmH family RNA methyltransferase n=1 Tax=Timonella sp. A28 TaxID=3442640 RepID=UPI003EB8DA0F
MIQEPTSTETAPERAEDASVIDDVRHPAIRRVVDVIRSKSAKPRTLIIDDEENIRQAVSAGLEIESLYVTPRFENAEELQQFTKATSLYVLGESAVKTLFKGDKSSRVFVLAKAPRLATWRDVASRTGDVLALDGVRIAGNIGAIIRSASAFDAAGVVLLDSDLTNVFDRRIIRASRGLVFSIPVIIATKEEFTQFLRTEDIPLACLAADGETPLSSISTLDGRISLLLGSERTGASTELEDAAKWRCSVPMNPNVESLNVSVATGIALYARHTPAQ